MAESSELDVLVVGGGMVGLTLAAALGHAGAAVAVIERAPAAALTEAEFDGRTSALAAASCDVLAAIGVWRALAPVAAPIREIRVTDGASSLFVHYDHRDIGDGPLGHIVENRDIRRVLLARLAALETVRLFDGRSVVTLERQGARAVARLDDGTVLAAPLAVAADGVRSGLRRAAGIAAMRWDYPQTGIVGTVAHERAHRGIAQERFLPAGPFAILPMTGNRSSIVWTERAALAPRLLALDDDEFLEELSLRFGDYLGRLALIGPRFSYPLALIHAESYVAPRLALIGEAAHCIHPIAGQGLNIALRDVAALAEVVVDALRDGDDPGELEVLRAYERWRRPDNLLMLAVTDGLNRLFSNDVAPLRLARDLGLAAVNRAGPLKRLFMRHAMGRVGRTPRLMRGAAL